MVRTVGAGAAAGAAAGTGAGAGAGAGEATGIAGPVSFRTWPGTITEYALRPFAASIALTSTPNLAAIEPTVSPLTTV